MSGVPEPRDSVIEERGPLTAPVRAAEVGTGELFGTRKEIAIAKAQERRSSYFRSYADKNLWAAS